MTKEELNQIGQVITEQLDVRLQPVHQGIQELRGEMSQMKVELRGEISQVKKGIVEEICEFMETSILPQFEALPTKEFVAQQIKEAKGETMAKHKEYSVRFSEYDKRFVNLENEVRKLKKAVAGG